MSKAKYRFPHIDWRYKPIEKTGKFGSQGTMVRIEPVRNGSNKWKNRRAGFIDYVSSHQTLIMPEEVDKVIARAEPDGEAPNENITRAFNFIDYLKLENRQAGVDFEGGENTNNIWCYDNHYRYNNQRAVQQNDFKKRSSVGDFKLVSTEDKEHLPNFHKNTHCWDCLISVKDGDLNSLMYENQFLLVDRFIRNAFNFPVNAVFSFHNNTNHPHIHILVFQDDKTPDNMLRQVPVIRQSYLDAAKKSVDYFFQSNKVQFEEFLKAKHELRDNFSAEKIVRSFIYDFKKIYQAVEGKFQFNRLEKEQKVVVERFADKLLAIETNDEMINKLQDNFKKFNEITDEYYESCDFLSEADQKKTLADLNKLREESRVALMNEILSASKQMGEYIENWSYNNGFDKTSGFANQEHYQNYMNMKEQISNTPTANKAFIVPATEIKDSMLDNIDNLINHNLSATLKLRQKIEAEKQKYMASLK